jgi:Fe-S cluster biogenesis protein NfuA
VETITQVERVLARVRPLLRADGGDVELVSVNRDSVAVRFTGRCAGCPTAHVTLHEGVERAIRLSVPGVSSVSLVEGS